MEITGNIRTRSLTGKKRGNNMSNTIVKEIRIHIRDHKTWVEYETKTGRITKYEANGQADAYNMAGTLAYNVEHWLEEPEDKKEER